MTNGYVGDFIDSIKLKMRHNCVLSWTVVFVIDITFIASLVVFLYLNI